MTVVMRQQERSPDHRNGHVAPQAIPAHAYRMQFLGAQKGAAHQGHSPVKSYLNFFSGKNPKLWRGEVPLYRSVVYRSVYTGIDLHYRVRPNGSLKYEWHLAPGADAGQIKWRYQACDTAGLQGDKLLLRTTIGTVAESAPLAYQWREGVKQRVSCRYEKGADGHFYFVLGPYQEDQPLIIDPELVFSTYTGSLQDNWGFTATPAADGGAYAGGVVFGNPGLSGYPTTLGAFQDTMNAFSDVVLSKFSADGQRLLYSTYLGGGGYDLPFSTLESRDGNLIVLGTTGSPDFPVRAGSYDTSYAAGPRGNLGAAGFFRADTGSDIFLSVFNNTGSALVGGTFVGGSDFDGKNGLLWFNLGDDFRGDLGEDTLGNIYFTTNTLSVDLPIGANAAQKTSGGGQDAYVGSFNRDLSQLRWATYVGGSQADALFSLSLSKRGSLYLTGATESGSFPFPTVGAYHDSLQGKVDGFLIELAQSDGSLRNFTYFGTPENDLSFFCDMDEDQNVVVFGQTYGNYPVIDTALYRDSGSAQFLQRFLPDLDSSDRATVFGTGFHTGYNISPTALLVDECGQLLLSGYMARAGGRGRRIGSQTLPLKNPYQASTDNQDFYFFALDRSWQELIFASYFGEDGAYDHVDGGSSRFRDDGSIIQGVCASCGALNNFPVTDSAYSDSNQSFNCNMAVFRFDFEVDQVLARVEVKIGEKDSACVPFNTVLEDRSINSDFLLIEYPDGRVDTNRNGQVTIQDTGYSTLRFLAVDTSCGSVDSASLRLYGVADTVLAAFSNDYDTCDQDRAVQFVNASQYANRFIWIFDDGDSAFSANPRHVFEPGQYRVRLISENRLCQRTDTAEQTLNILDRTDSSSFELLYDPCRDGHQARLRLQYNRFHQLRLELNDQALTYRGEDTLLLPNLRNGPQQLILFFEDTVCGRTKRRQVEWEVFDGAQALTMPNVFTPNGDGHNDFFGPLEPPEESRFESYAFTVYDRWGNPLYRTDEVQGQWDGRVQQKQSDEGVYYYLLTYRDLCGNTGEIRGFTHLKR